jgi:1-acyl-sn-glycerol-3-phosphate acyltransferase
MPSALVVPFVIRDNSKLHKKGYFPLCVGKHLRYYALEPIERGGLTHDQIISKVEESIKSILLKD